MFKDTFLVVFGCDLLISGEIFALKHVVLLIKCPEMQAYFEYCAVLTHSTPFRWLVGPFSFGNITY